jgi:Tfp pilus assembly protein PilF
MYSGIGFSVVFNGLNCLLLLMAAFPAASRAQFEPANPVKLIVRVYIGSFQNPAPSHLTVQITDWYGGMPREEKTDESGRVEFHAVTKTYRVRVFGPGIQEYNDVVEIEAMETRKTFNAIVKADSHGSGATPGKLDSGMISTNRLKAPEKAQKEFEKGSESLDKKTWGEARKHFEAAIAIYPDYDVAYNGLGQALANSGDAAAARVAFERAIKINDNFAMAYRNLAKISLSERKFDEMDSLLTRSLSSDPLNAWALAYAAYSELQLHKFDDAIDHARKAHSVPHDGLASIHIVAARALEEKQQLAEAAAEYRLYLQEDPTGRDAERARKAVARLSGSPPS